MILYGLNKLTLLDYPEHLACTAFTSTCNFRCPFCHNASLVLSPSSCQKITEEEFFTFLNTRKGRLEGVCITGGEPTLQADLIPFIRKIKEQGFLVKLDTNGYQPNILAKLLSENLLDMVAMDIKNSWNKYDLTSGAHYLKEVEKSISILLSNKIDYEFRTTVVKQLHSKEDFEIIGQMIQGAKNYFIQRFQENESVIDKKLSAPDKEELIEYLTIVKKYVPNAMLRGID